MTPVWPQIGALAWRSVVRTSRQPAAVVFPLIFPMMLLLVNSGGLQASTELPGFPTDSFVAFALAVPFIQGALFSTMNAGTDLAKAGVLERYQVRLLGASLETIRNAEDRQAFKEMLESIGEQCPVR